MSGRGPERQDVECVLFQRSPADEGQSSIRLEATTNVDERRSGVSEEHYPKPREGSIERGRFERKHLGIRVHEAHSIASFGRALRERQYRGRQIYPHDYAVGRDCPGKVKRGLTATATYVEDTLTRPRCKRRQSAPTKRSEL